MLREGHRLKVCENRVLRGVFGPKRGEMLGGRRKLHNEYYKSYYWPNIIKMIM